MHPNCMKMVNDVVSSRFPVSSGKKILEVGSTNINGGIRHLFPDSEYIGVDIVPFEGVDLVLENHYKFPFEDNTFDLAISTNTLEHCTRPWETIKEMARVVKPGGLVINVCPWQIHVMRSMMEDAGLEIIDCYMQEYDTAGVGKKRINPEGNYL